jgi:hypothetical protein
MNDAPLFRKFAQSHNKIKNRRNPPIKDEKGAQEPSKPSQEEIFP